MAGQVGLQDENTAPPLLPCPCPDLTGSCIFLGLRFSTPLPPSPGCLAPSGPRSTRGYVIPCHAGGKDETSPSAGGIASVSPAEPEPYSLPSAMHWSQIFVAICCCWAAAFAKEIGITIAGTMMAFDLLLVPIEAASGSTTHHQVDQATACVSAPTHHDHRSMPSRIALFYCSHPPLLSVAIFPCFPRSLPLPSIILSSFLNSL